MHSRTSPANRRFWSGLAVRDLTERLEELWTLRKYRLGFKIAHQYLQQLSPEIRHSILGNIGTAISFRVGAVDALYLAKEFQDEFERMELNHLENYVPQAHDRRHDRRSRSVLSHSHQLTKPAKPPPMAGRKQEVRQLRE
jgi:hypothetical protein